MTDAGIESEIITSPVNVELVSVDRLASRGSVRAIARVILTIADVEILINGIAICRDDQGWTAKCPQHRNATGIWSNAVELPQSILNTVMELVCEQLTADADPRMRK